MSRTALWFNALSVAGLGLLLLLLAGLLSPLFGLDAGFMRPVGALPLPFAAFLALTASRERISRVAVGWVVALNAIYVLARLRGAAAWLAAADRTRLGLRDGASAAGRGSGGGRMDRVEARGRTGRLT